MRNKETDLQDEIRIELQKAYQKLRTFRNNTGEAWQGKSYKTTKGHLVIENPQRVKYGLKKGSSDVIGIMPVVITPEMVGKTIGVFMALEVKTKNGKLSTEQQDFLENIAKLGGISGEVRSVEDAIKLISDFFKP